MSLFKVTKKQVIENYELRTMTGDIVSFIPSYSQLLPDPFSDLNVTVNVVASGGNGTPDNPVPINGYSSANITRCGVNLMHVNSRVSQTTADVTYTSDDNYIYLNGTKSGGGYADMSNLTMTLPRGTYYLKAFVISGTASNTVSLYAFDGTNNISPDILGGEKSMTLNKTTTFRFRMAIWADGTVCTNYKVGIVISTASISEYSEYTGNTYTISFGQTVYGGVLDVTRGKLTVTHGFYSGTWGDGGTEYAPDTMPDMKRRTFTLSPQGGDTTANNGHSKVNITDVFSTANNLNSPHFYVYDNLYLYAPRTLDDNTPVQCSYVLATPFDIDLTPEVISAVVGTNNVFADCGQTTVTCLI